MSDLVPVRSFEIESPPKEDLNLIAQYFLDQFKGFQINSSDLMEILKASSFGGGIQAGSLAQLIQSAIEAAYQQGVAECHQSGAGSFDLKIDIQLPFGLAIKLVRELKFALQTACRLGRKHGLEFRKRAAIDPTMLTSSVDLPQRSGTTVLVDAP